MIKAIFMDFYGTAVHENGPIAMEVAQRICETSSADSPEEVFHYWRKIFPEKLKNVSTTAFRTQHEIALEGFEELLIHFHSKEDPFKLLERMEEHWRTTAAYDDARTFLDAVSLPVYFVTNSDDSYVMAAASKAGLHPAGIITSEQARCYKPNKGIFLCALEKTGCTPGEVIHIGDSLHGDVECARSAGIKGIWLNREGKPVPEGVTSVENLAEALTMLSIDLPNN